MALLSTVYCTEAQLQRFLSTNAVTDFADHDDDGAADTDVVNDCINQATEELDFFLRQRYDQADLSTSQIVERWCVVGAAKFLCERRGNVIPDSIMREFDRIYDPGTGHIAAIAEGRRQLPNVPLRADLRPTWSNLTVDRRYRRSTVRVTDTNSSDANSDLTRDLVNEVPRRFD